MSLLLLWQSGQVGSGDAGPSSYLFGPSSGALTFTGSGFTAFAPQRINELNVTSGQLIFGGAATAAYSAAPNNDPVAYRFGPSSGALVWGGEATVVASVFVEVVSEAAPEHKAWRPINPNAGGEGYTPLYRKKRKPEEEAVTPTIFDWSKFDGVKSPAILAWPKVRAQVTFTEATPLPHVFASQGGSIRFRERTGEDTVALFSQAHVTFTQGPKTCGCPTERHRAVQHAAIDEVFDSALLMKQQRRFLEMQMLLEL